MPSRSITFVRELIWELGRVADVASITPRGSKRKLVRAWSVLTIRQRRGAAAHGGFALEWIGPNGSVRAAVFDPSEIRVIREVFVNKEYALPEEARPTSILDLGSNVGMSILYFQNRYPNARIIGVEPASSSFARLRQNTQALPNVSVIQAAAVGTSRTVDLVVSRESWSSSVHGDRENDTVEHIAGLTVEQILESQGVDRVDVIKMDVEGCEVEILERSSAVHETDWLIFEFHQEHTTRDVWQLIDQLREFEIVRIVGDTQQHPLVTLRRRAKPSHPDVADQENHMTRGSTAHRSRTD